MADERDRTVRLGEVLRAYLGEGKLLGAAREHLVAALWPQVVGDWYARHTHVARVWEGVVEVECDSAARAQQLQLDSAEIMRRLNARLGEPYVREIRPGTAARPGSRKPDVAHGSRGYVSRAPTQAELDAMALTDMEERWIQDQAAAIPDVAVREVYVRTLRTQLKLRHWKLDHGWVVCSKCGELYDSNEGCLQCRLG
ncbi:MAG: DUF721 domain-containing protein [Armatimonadetes bacterium]|nr:DUF721 domain-containing protein [Armatimonadota bacterium]